MSTTEVLSLNQLDAIQAVDPEIHDLIRLEERRQANVIRLIPSENYASRAVMQATGTVLTNKYSEGYAGKRYYEGQEYIDQVERIAVERAKALFNMPHANVQPYSGSPANQAIYLALLEPGDKVMGMALPSGGHLTHGAKVSFSGKLYTPVPYTVSAKDHLLDFTEIRRIALEERPKLIFCGHSAYPRVLDFAKFAEIAKEVGAVLVSDIAHISGLVVSGAHPSPAGIVDIVSTTTHKTLRGPRGGMLLSREEYGAALDKAVFPGLQGGPHNHTTAAIAVALKEAATPEFTSYGHQIVRNAKALAEGLLSHGFRLITGGTENHLILIDITNKGLSGREAAKALAEAGIVANCNAIPFDTRKPFDPSGVRIGTPAITSRGMKEPEMKRIADWMAEVVASAGVAAVKARVAGEVRDLCASFPAPGISI
ncbi:MAG: serine hydroxymethyltransferase [Candidatus Omnitrophica bacterium]|nr:Serine hydroxymethyltransferase [bacterium]NUN96392.1 serine hydroxymethyltransferase [Candidatus Omnitrophota bacterium]